MKEKKNPCQLSDKRRLVVMAFSIFCMLSFLLFQFFKLQILEGEKWAKKAQLQHQFVVKEPYKRGVFYSKARYRDLENPYKSLVVDIPMFHLFIDPLSISEEFKQIVSEKLCRILDISEDKKTILKQQFEKKSRSRKLATWLSREQKEEIEKWWFSFAKKEKLPRNAVYFVGDYKRSYPCGKLLGQVLHTIREDREVGTNQAIPTGGLELYFNKELQGEEGKRRLLRSPRYALDRGDLIKSPTNGADVYLTIDHYIQAIAEEEIAKGVQKAKAKSGWAIVMEPKTGEILALAQYPFFYPENYRQYYSDKKLIEETKVKAITDCFEPGSVLKPLSLAIVMQANKQRILLGDRPLFDPEEKLNLRRVKFPGRKTPIKDVATSQFLNMKLALQKSSNIYISHMIQRVVDQFGDRWYRDQLFHTFGLGEKTGVELPSETIGFLPDIGKYYPNGKPQWSVPTPGCLAIGYNLLVNSIQVLKAWATLCNGGYLVKPTILKKIVKKKADGSEEVLLDNSQNKILKKVLDEDITREVISALKLVTKPGGSAFRADVPGFTEAGKTSTSEKIRGGVYAKQIHFSSFVGFTPAENAKIVVVIGIDEPEYRYLPGIGKTHYGGKCAAPVFREIAKRTLKYMGETPDDPYGYQIGDPRREPDKADMLEEISYLRKLFLEWHK